MLYPVSPLILLALFSRWVLPTLIHPRPHLIEPNLSPWGVFLAVDGFLLLWFAMSAGICLHTHHSDLLHNLWATVRTIITPADRLLPDDSFAETLLGYGIDGTPLTLSSGEIRGHALVIGATQTGKSTFAALWARQQSDHSLLVIDPHAALVHRLLADGILREYPPDAVFPLVLGMDFVPGWNLLQPLSDETAADCARRLTNVATDVFFGGDTTDATRFRDVLFHTAWALAATGWTVAEINFFLRSKTFRAHIARRVTHLPALRQWLADAAAMSDARWRERTESTANRFGIFQTGEAALIFGQRRSTLDVDAFLRRSQALWLAPLTVDALHRDGAYLVAAMLLAVTDARLAHRQKGADHPPLLIVADEFQRYPTAALERLLTERAGFGASLLPTTGLRMPVFSPVCPTPTGSTRRESPRRNKPRCRNCSAWRSPSAGKRGMWSPGRTAPGGCNICPASTPPTGRRNWRNISHRMTKPIRGTPSRCAITSGSGGNGTPPQMTSAEWSFWRKLWRRLERKGKIFAFLLLWRRFAWYNIFETVSQK